MHRGQQALVDEVEPPPFFCQELPPFQAMDFLLAECFWQKRGQTDLWGGVAVQGVTS